MGAMSKKDIDAVLDCVRTWPLSRQEDAAQVLLQMEASGTDVDHLSDEERADIQAALEEADRGEFATDEEVAAVFNKYRR
jgi:predicted transcriptional regulator